MCFWLGESARLSTWRKTGQRQQPSRLIFSRRLLFQREVCFVGITPPPLMGSCFRVSEIHNEKNKFK